LTEQSYVRLDWPFHGICCHKSSTIPTIFAQKQGVPGGEKGLSLVLSDSCGTGIWFAAVTHARGYLDEDGDICMRFNPVPGLDRERDQDIFESVTEEEIIYLWRSIKNKGLSEDEAWQAIVTGIALDMAFAKTKATKQLEH
jgi:hypothetical protein